MSTLALILIPIHFIDAVLLSLWSELSSTGVIPVCFWVCWRTVQMAIERGGIYWSISPSWGSYHLVFQIGYYLTATGMTRTIQMMFLLPCMSPHLLNASHHLMTTTVLIKLCKPKSLEQGNIPNRTTVLLRFDLAIAFVSLVVTLVGFTGQAVVRDPILFLLAGVIQSLGYGYAPAMQSANLELYRRTGGTETGKLFGAVGVLQTIGWDSLPS